MKIIIVEDDYLQSDLIKSEIYLQLGKVDISLFETESDFRNHLPNLENDPPDIILLDIMLRWTDPSPNMPETPDDVKEEGFYNAGFRCQKIISNNLKLKDIPIILYSVLDKIDLIDKLIDIPKTVTHLTKDKNISILINQIKKSLHDKV